MKKFIIIALTLIVICPAHATIWPFKKKEKASVITEVVEEPQLVLQNDVDSMSYALAVNIATDLSNNLQTLPNKGAYNLDLFLLAFNTVMQGDSTIISPENAGGILQEYFTLAQEKEAKEQRSEGEQFLKENAMNPAVQTTASGLQYVILTETDGPKPLATDKVKVHYEGTLTDGTVFDSSYQRGEPIDFQLDQVIAGWTEGVQLMSVGSKYKFFIPYDLAYGEQGASGVIPPYATLIFTVELLGINETSFLDQIQELEIK